MYESINGKKLIKILFVKVFTSDIIGSIVNIVIPCLLSLHSITYKKGDIPWYWITGIFLVILIVYNILSCIIRRVTERQNKQLNIVYNCYNEQRSINSKFATYIYRLNKAINGYISSSTPIDKKSLDKIADFQTFSFCVCESIYKIINKEFGDDILCQVTLMKKENNIVKMVAYANDNEIMPSSYKEEFHLDSSDIFFITLFNDLNGEIRCIPKKEDIGTKFKIFNGSSEREKNICQYIGIPVKTERNEIEFVLQIDVSKPDIFGKNEKEMKIFAKNVFYPYAMMLYKTYERDLVFNQYYDLIVTMLSKTS